MTTQEQFLGLPIFTLVGVLLSAIIIPILWWMVRRSIDWLRFRLPTRLVLGDVSKNAELCNVILPDFEVYPNSSSLLRRFPPRLGGEIYANGVNIPTVWADCDGQAVSDILNVLGQVGKKENIVITRYREDSGIRNCHLIFIGGQDALAQEFYNTMEGVYYRMNGSQIWEVNRCDAIPRDEKVFGYGLILKAKNPFKIDKRNGMAILVGGFGVLGTMAAAYYLRTHIRDLGVRFGNGSFGVVIRAPIATGYQGAQRIMELDMPQSSWQRILSKPRSLIFR